MSTNKTVKLRRKRSPTDPFSDTPSNNKKPALSIPKGPRIVNVSRIHDTAVDEFMDVLEELECCQIHDAGGPLVMKASTMLMSIKTLQRQLLDTLQLSTAKMETKKTELRKQTLALESITYESKHLKHQLDAYAVFPTPQLEKMAREELKDSDSDVNDVINKFLCGSVIKSHEDPKQHDTIMQKLHKEINARGTLERNVKLAHKTLGRQKQLFTDKQAFMADLPRKLDLIEKASLPLQQFFQTGTDMAKLTSDRRTRLDLAKSLPGPLYTLFIQLQSHLDSLGYHPGTTMQVVPQLKGDRKGDPTFDKNTVQLTLPLADITIKEGALCSTLCIDFVYYPTLKIVTARAKGNVDKINPESVLANLFPGDNGEFTLIQVGEVARKLSGRPYSWCNYMAGLHLATPCGDASSMTLCTKVVVTELSKRVRAHSTLTQLLFGFAKRKVHPVHPAMANDIIVDPSCLAKLYNFAEYSSEHHPTNNNETCYQATIKRKGITIRAIVIIDRSQYPSTPPIWSLMTCEEEWGQLHGSATSLEAGTNPLYDSVLGSIEREVNFNLIALVKQDVLETHDWILSHQLQTIINMWDQSQKAAEGGSLNGVRVIKGRDRL